MNFVLTLVSSTIPLQIQHLATITRILETTGLPLAGEPRWLTPHKAADLYVPQRPGREQIQKIRKELEQDRIDLLINTVRNRKKKLLLSDMDATILENETLDDLSDVVGLGEECRIITEKTMRGEMDLPTAIRERVALLKDMPEDVLRKTLANVTYSAGAELLVRGMAQHGAVCVLVSSGFTYFTGGVAKALGFTHHHGNVLEMKNGVLTGMVAEPIQEKRAKLAHLHHYADALGLKPEEILAIGDGSNDLLMLEAAGLGIGYRPKPLLVESLDSLILYGDLSAALYAQGLVPNLH